MRCDCMHELYVQHGNNIMRHVPFILDATRRKSSMVMDALNNGKKKKALRIKELTTYSKVNS